VIMKTLPIVASVAFATGALLAAPSLSQAASDAPSAAASPAATPSTARPKVTWQEALERAFRRNTSAVVAQQEILRADALVREARASWLPTLTGNGSYVHLDRDRVFNGMVTTPQNTWNANLQLNVPLLAPGAWVNDAHAQDSREVTKVTATDVRRQLGVAVGRAYLTVVLQHRQIEVAARARETAFAHYDYAHTRLQHGLGNGVDDARAEQQLRMTEAQVKNAETALIRAQSALAVLLSEDDLVDVADDVSLATAPTPEAALADARSQRADLRVLDARKAATSNLRRDDWVFYAPTLLAQAQAFRQTRTALLPASGWQAGLVLSVPFFEGGLREGVIKERAVAEREAQAQLDGLMRQVSLEVRSAFAVVRNADDSLGSARAAAIAATTAATLADKSYRGGASTNIEVIDAERQARDAESQVALSEDAARQARLDLLLATGAFP